VEAALIHVDRHTDRHDEGNRRLSRQGRLKIIHPILATIQKKSDDESDEITRRKMGNISIHNEQEARSAAHLTTGTKQKLLEKRFRKFGQYRVIPKSLRDFRPLRYRSRDGHAEGERVNRGRDTPSFCPTLQVLDMSTLGDAADVNPVIKFLPHTLQNLEVDSSDCLRYLSSQLW
jgi:hypothetical protein